jgi:hypothetical protein
MAQLIRIENFNTNNGWGFGGVSGNRYYYDNGICIIKGSRSYRHTGGSGYSKVTYQGIEVVGANGMPTKLFKYISNTAIDIYTIKPLKEVNGKIMWNYHEMKFVGEVEL